MKLRSCLPALAALTAGLVLVAPQPRAIGDSPAPESLTLDQRHFLVFNNFADAAANANQTADARFPDHFGAVMALWKASVEWGSLLHADGAGDPHQPLDLGSGGANFDARFAGESLVVGSTNGNTHSALSGSSGGVFAFTETPISDGWRVRYYDTWIWEDGPDTAIPGGHLDLQAVATHEIGHSLGLGHSSVAGSTMYAGIQSGGSGVDYRSIEDDDRAAIQALYGIRTPTKPHIASVDVSAGIVTLRGDHFDLSSNEVLLPGAPVSGVASDGKTIQLALPPGAVAGDVLVRVPGTQHDRLSNAFPFDPQDTGCAGPIAFCPATASSRGVPAVIGWAGSLGVSANDFSLHAAPCPVGQSGLFFYGGAQQQVPFGNGILCVSPGTAGVFRLGLSPTGPIGHAALALDFGAPPSAAGQITPGSTWTFQYWFRDPAAGGAGFNLSTALAVTFCN